MTDCEGSGSDHSLHETFSWHLTTQTEENHKKSQDTWCPDSDFNQANPAYKSTALLLPNLSHKTFIKNYSTGSPIMR